MKKSVAEIAQLIKGTIVGNGDVLISDVTNISNPREGCISFIDNPRFLKDAEASTLSCLLVPETITTSSKPIIRVASPKLSFAHLLTLFHPPRTFSGQISPKASIAPTAHIEKNVTIEDYVVIGDHVRIGTGSVIRSFSYIDAHTTIGSHTLIHPQVMVYDHTIIGDRVIIHSSSVIGSDGFGYVRNAQGELVKIQQLGNVIIEDDVEMGSNVSVDRATFGSTIIKRGTKLDNLIQVAHNVTIDSHTTISGHAGIAGSAHIGKYCTIAAQAGIGDHATLEDKVIIGGQAGVASKKRIPEGAMYMGTPARPIEHFREQLGLLAKLPHVIEEIKELKKAAHQNEPPVQS